ncbi:MAG: T9SS type A sorting domain-containing protein [Bacteroidetes bacterium]|nr:T9SS type A sorting domain-containing protein [Bacteroidota bacterium]
MKKLLLLSIFLIVVSAQAQSVWTEYATAQPTALTGVRSISIVDENVTWLNMRPGNTGISAIRRFAKTDNGGTVWTTGAIDLGPNSLNLEIANIHGVSSSVAYASVFPSGGGVQGGIWQTTDGGTTWTRQATAAFSDPASFTNLVYFWNAQEGIAAGDPANGYFEIYKTSDGGSNWSRIASTPALVPIDPQEYGMPQFAVSGNSIWIGTTFGRLLHSTDKGATWSVAQSPIPDFGGGINGSGKGHLAFSDVNHGLLMTDAYELYRTNDGGATWTAVFVANDTAMKNFGISAVPGHPNMYVTVGQDLLLSPTRGSAYTLDAGNTWFHINDTNQVDGGIVSMLNENYGFASGFSYSSTVGGIFRWNGMATLPVQYNSNILLHAFIDTNNNGVQDANESDYHQGTFSYQVNSDAPHYINSYNGSFALDNINPLDSYNLAFSIFPGAGNCSNTYTLPVASFNNVSLPANSGTVVYNFPLVPTNVNCTDLLVNLITFIPPRPSNSYVNTIYYKNNSNQIIASGVITFDKDPNVTINIVYPNNIVTTPTGFTYTFTNLQPNESRYMSINMQVPPIPTVALGQLLTAMASITPTDSFPQNNTSTLSQTIVASYDPNDITEKHGGKILHSSFTSDDYLTYTIRFENTGTADALNIRVVDLLDAQLDETSIRMIDASHPYILDRVGQNLTWSFDNINLPPSVADTDTGKGYIVFEVKPKPGYAIGDIIPNTADIYFDTNPAITTNTFPTEFVATLAVNQLEDADFAIYPNPTTNLINISAKKTNALIESITLMDVLGKVIRNQNVHLSNASADVSELAKGLYFLKIKSNGVEKVIKITKE